MENSICDGFMQVSAFVLIFCWICGVLLWRFVEGVGARFTILMTDDLTAYGMSDIYPHCCSKRSSIVMCTSIVVSFTHSHSSRFRHVATIARPFEPSQPRAH